MKRLVIALLACAFGSVAAPWAGAQPGPAAQAAQRSRTAWPTYEVFLWTFGDRKLTPAFFETLRSIGVTGINREEGADAAAVVDAGFAHYVGHAPGKRVLNLKRDVFDEQWNRHWERRDRASLHRPLSLHDPAVRRGLRERLAKTLKRALPHRPRAISLGDEISVTKRVTPIDFDFSPRALAAFRAWLRERYGSIEALNARWRTTFERFDDVVPMTADEIKRRERGRPRDRRSFAPWADHRAFADATLAGVLRDLRAEARRRGATAPIGFLGGQAPAPYGGYDWSRLLREVDWVEAYDEGGAMEVVRGLAPDVIRVRTYFRSGGDEALNRFRLWKYFAHGDRGAVLWSDQKALDAKGAPTAYARALAPTLAALVSPACAPIVPLPVANDGIAIYYSQASIRRAWIRDSWRDGLTWMKRFGSYERNHASHYQCRMAWHRLLEDAGVQYRYVDRRRLLAGLANVRLLVLPEVWSMDAEEQAAVEVFLDGGGAVVADHAEGIEALRGKHRSLHLVGSVRRSLVRASPATRGPLTPFGRVASALRAVGIEPRCRVVAEGRNVAVEVIRRPTADRGTYHVFLRNLTPTEEKRMRPADWSKPEPVEIRFPTEVRYRMVVAPAGPDHPTGIRLGDADAAWRTGRVIEGRVAATCPLILYVERT